MENRYMSAEEAARMLGTSRRAVRNMVAGGMLETAEEGEGGAARLAISTTSVQKLLSERQAASATR